MSAKLALLIVALLLVLLPWALWRIGAVRAVAPLAVVQTLAGIALGPSLFGRLAPELHAALFAPANLAALNGVSAIGVLLFVFVTGMHLDIGALRRNRGGLTAIALSAFALPLALGAALGVWVAAAVPGALGPHGGMPVFVLAFAICVAVTALPVLAAILQELELIGTRLGQTALAIAAINDAALWVVLAALLALVAESGLGVGGTIALALAWLALMIGVVRPLLAWLARGQQAEARMLVIGAATALAAAASAEAIGLDYILGSFIAGAIMPAGIRAALIAKIEPLTATVLLPFFFMTTGLNTLIDPASGSFLAIFALATAATVIGKVAGAALPARRAGESWSFALALGVMMQTKGLMEVVVLTVLHQAGLIGGTVFSALISMAVVCTVIPGALTRVLARKAAVHTSGSPAQPSRADARRPAIEGR
ncbi:MAG TPA: cation:proton antiporter [Roseomonas sp.]|jgi:Kef-type K+ transport system membrane component KefB